MLTFPIVPPLHDGYMYIYANIKENKLQVDMNFLYQHSREWFMNVKEYEDCHSYSSKEVNNYFIMNNCSDLPSVMVNQVMSVEHIYTWISFLPVTYVGSKKF